MFNKKKELLGRGFSEKESDIIIEEINKIPENHQEIILKRDGISTLLKMGIGFAGSLLNHVASGMKKVSQKEMSRRIDICKGCEFFTDGEHPSCSKCGCYMNIKARWESEHCPIDKW